jgi:hypothetical protein
MFENLPRDAGEAGLLLAIDGFSHVIAFPRSLDTA